jgi:hypothetical protein
MIAQFRELSAALAALEELGCIEIALGRNLNMMASMSCFEAIISTNSGMRLIRSQYIFEIIYNSSMKYRCNFVDPHYDRLTYLQLQTLKKHFIVSFVSQL